MRYEGKMVHLAGCDVLIEKITEKIHLSTVRGSMVRKQIITNFTQLKKLLAMSWKKIGVDLELKTFWISLPKELHSISWFSFTSNICLPSQCWECPSGFLGSSTQWFWGDVTPWDILTETLRKIWGPVRKCRPRLSQRSFFFSFFFFFFFFFFALLKGSLFIQCP